MRSNLSNSQRSLLTKIVSASNYSKTSIYGSGAYVQISKEDIRVYKIRKFLESTD
jgi:hypothetical protein